MSERHEQAAVSVEEARAAVVATEEAVRVAVERAREVTLRLERLGSGRHLSHELVEIEVEIDHAWQAMHEAEQRAYQIEQGQLAQQDTIPEQSSIDTGSTSAQSLSSHDTVSQTSAPLQEQEIVISEQVENTPIAEEVQETQVPRDIVTHMSRIEQIERIDEEEEMVEMGAAMTAADVAAAAAAEAEAFAQASSARTREVQRLVEQADKILERVHVAIQRGVLVGDAAEATLYEAEHDATHARTLLADAEATEERARRAAMNAEAEAEVAEGMARATQGRFADEDYRDATDYAFETPGTSYSHNATNGDATIDDNVADKRESNADEDDADDTLQMPSVRLKEQQNHRQNETM